MFLSYDNPGDVFVEGRWIEKEGWLQRVALATIQA